MIVHPGTELWDHVNCRLVLIKSYDSDSSTFSVIITESLDDNESDEIIQYCTTMTSEDLETIACVPLSYSGEDLVMCDYYSKYTDSLSWAL